MKTWCDCNGEGEKHCPYWGGRGGAKCEMTKDGVFIPLVEHVQTFCQDDHYYLQCEQYKRSLGLLSERQPPEVEGHKSASRRRYRRVETRLPVSLALCDQDGLAAKGAGNEAVTLDMSFGGVRLEGSHFLETSSLVAFTFDEQFSPPGWTGFGAVQWCRAGERAGAFQSGLAIIDQRTSQVIGQHIGVVSS